MRTRAVLCSALALLLATAPGDAAAQSINAGDLIVSYGDELWRVDAETGARARLSPRPDAISNEIGLDGSEQIAIDREGAVFLLSDEQVIEIDLATGGQSVLRQRTRFCSMNFCTFVSAPLDLGTNPRGIDANPVPATNFGDRVDLFVGSEDAVYRIVREAGEVYTQMPWFDSPQDEFPFLGPLVASTGSGMWLAGPDLHSTSSPPTPIFFPAIEAPGTIRAIDYENGLVFVAMTPGSGTPAAGVWIGGGGGFFPLTQGGYLRRPSGIAVDPLRPDRIWVADRGALSTPNNRLVRLDYDGVDWRQTIFAEFPDDAKLHGIAVSPVSFVPEPGALGAAAAALMLLARWRAANAATADAQ